MNIKYELNEAVRITLEDIHETAKKITKEGKMTYEEALVATFKIFRSFYKGDEDGKI